MSVEPRGTLAQRPAADADSRNDLYFATDGGSAGTGGLYQSNGAAWILLSDLGASVPTAKVQTASPDTIWRYTPNQAATPADYSFQIINGVVGGTTETMFRIGYNVDQARGGEPGGAIDFLPNCQDSNAFQWQFDVWFANGGFKNAFKLFAMRDGTNAIKWNFDMSGTGGYFIIADGATQHFSIVKSGDMTLSPAGLIFASKPLITLDYFWHRGTLLGFFNHSVDTQKTVTGSRGGNAALASLLTALAAYGAVVDSSTA